MTPARIAFCCPGADPAPWAEELARRLPGAILEPWSPGAPATADYALVWSPPQRFIDEQPQLRGLFNTGAGVDALLRLRLPPGLPIVRLEDAGMAVQMAEYVCHAVIEVFRGLPQLRQQQAQALWKLPPAPDRAAYPVGVMGLGVLGSRVAQALRAFEFPVHAWTRTPPVAPGCDVVHHAGWDALPGFLSTCRAVVCLLPLTPETENLLDRRRLLQLPRGAHLINVARGAHVVDEDLLALLDEGHIGAATLDVFRQEPLPVDHPFWRHPRVRLSPHTSARTLRGPSIEQIVGKIAQAAAGVPWPQIGGWVDRSRGY